MGVSRRGAVVGLAALAAACSRPRVGAGAPARLDLKRLDRGFPGLADRARPGIFGMGVSSLSTDQSWYWNTDRLFPLQSVFKAPLAAAALAKVDAGRLSLDERITFNELDLAPPYSLIDEKWPTPPDHHTASIPMRTLMSLAVQVSDNTAADVLMKRIGGPRALTAWLQSKAINEMRVDRYERELQVELEGMPSFRPAWKDEAAFIAARETIPAPQRQAAMDAYLADPRDTTTLPGALDFLTKLARGDLISGGSTDLLMRLMGGARTGVARLKAGLPRSAAWAHKTGSSRTDLGFTPATNDIGVVTFEDGRRYAIAAFLAGSTATDAERDRVFADAARLVTAAAI
ncbi:MAG: class A beta-lactamase [Caulobacterales bacterium]